MYRGFCKAAGFVDSVPTFFTDIYTYAWFVGLIIAIVIYTPIMRAKVARQ